MLYLKIENPGVAPVEALTTLGVSFSNEDNNANTIGRFGSGSSHASNLLLRNNINPIIFCGNLRLEYFTENKYIRDDRRSKVFQQICVKLTGKTEDGKTKNTTEKLSVSLDYGSADWTDISMALREYVSNAIDQNLQVNGTWKQVKIEIADNPRAKAGHTRVYVPVTPDVQEFYNNLGKWFLHFSEPELIDKTILPKRGRELFNEKLGAVIYRKGVRVREITHSKSLFDYNLSELRLDEARVASDYDVKYYSARALSGGTRQQLTEFIQSFNKGKYWEHEFDSYALLRTYNDDERKLREKNWVEAADSVSEASVIVSNESTDAVRKKGFVPIKVSESVAEAAKQFGVRTPAKVLSEDERLGRDIQEPNEAALQVLDYCWGMIEKAQLTQGKSKPSVKMFNEIMKSESVCKGFYRIGEDAIYLNRDICDGNSEELRMTCLEELVHYLTQAFDCSRDMQDFILRLAVRSSANV